MQYEPAAEQPITTEIRMADGVFVKSAIVAKAGTFLPQHSHRYDHISYIAAGGARVWADGELLGDFHGPTGVVIVAHTKHLFKTLEDNTVILCIHNASRADDVEVEDEHQIVGVT